MDISRRRALGLFAGGAGVAGLAGCASSGVATDGAALAAIPTSPVNVSFEHGIASGDSTQTSVIVWTRVTPEKDTDEQITVRCVMSTSRELVENDGLVSGPMENADVIVLLARTGKARDYTVKLDAGAESALSPDTVYYYQFAVVTPSGAVKSALGRTRTIPATGGEKLSLAVVSCSNYPFGFFNAYKAIADRDDVDAVVHLGDYLYEYGADGYGGEEGEKLGRRVNPVTEIVSLEDYRTRHAQYKTDPNLQAAHQYVPWFCTWDDHESANDSYRTGAENHNPENNEGDWTSRKQRAIQAYLEWMPVRDPQPGRAIEAIYRRADFGDLVTMYMLESRLTGRSDEISWGAELFGVEPENIPAKAMATMAKVSDPSRTMLGKVQEDWLAAELKSSVASGKSWQLLANQVILSKVLPPDFGAVLSPEELANLPDGYGQLLGLLAKMGLPFNLDAWDGFPAARDRLYASAMDAGARLITITGDTHTAWANMPHAADGTQVGVEFGCTSITSPGLGKYLPFDKLGEYVAGANADVAWYDPFGHGFTMLTITPDKARADFYKVSTIEAETFETSLVASFEAVQEDGVVSPLKQV